MSEESRKTVGLIQDLRGRFGPYFSDVQWPTGLKELDETLGSFAIIGYPDQAIEQIKALALALKHATIFGTEQSSIAEDVLKNFEAWK